MSTVCLFLMTLKERCWYYMWLKESLFIEPEKIKDDVKNKIFKLRSMLKDAIDNNKNDNLEIFIICNCSSFLTSNSINKNIRNLSEIINIIQKYLVPHKLEEDIIYNNYFKEICKKNVILPYDIEVHGGYLFELYIGQDLHYKPKIMHKEERLVKKRRNSLSSLGEKAKEYFNIEINVKGKEDKYNKLCDLFEYIEYELFSSDRDEYNGKRRKKVSIFDSINKISLNLFESSIKEHEYYQYDCYGRKSQSLYQAMRFLVIELTKDNYFFEYLKCNYESINFIKKYVEFKNYIYFYSDECLSINNQMQYYNDLYIAHYYEAWIKRWHSIKDFIMCDFKNDDLKKPVSFEQHMMFYLFKLRVSTYLGYLKEIESKYDFTLDNSQQEALFELYSFIDPNLPNWKETEKFFMDKKEQVEKVLKSGKIKKKNYFNLLRKVKKLFHSVIERQPLGQRTEDRKYDKCYILSIIQLYWLAINNCEETTEFNIPYSRAGRFLKKWSALLKNYDDNRTIEMDSYLYELIRKRYDYNIGLVKSYELIIKAVIELNELIYDLVGRYPKDFTKTNNKEIQSYEEMDFYMQRIEEELLFLNASFMDI